VIKTPFWRAMKVPGRVPSAEDRVQFYLQLPDSFDRHRGDWPDLRAFVDHKENTWEVRGLDTKVTGEGTDPPDPHRALHLLRLQIAQGLEAPKPPTAKEKSEAVLESIRRNAERRRLGLNPS